MIQPQPRDSHPNADSDPRPGCRHCGHKIEVPDGEVQWRVVSKYPGWPLSYNECPDEQRAREWAEQDRRLYSDAEIWIECRVVMPWECVDG